MPHYTALLKLEFSASDHDEANEHAWTAKNAIEEHALGIDVTLVNDRCEEVDVSAAETIDLMPVVVDSLNATDAPIDQRVAEIERDLNDNLALFSDRDEANLRYLIATVRGLLSAAGGAAR